MVMPMELPVPRCQYCRVLKMPSALLSTHNLIIANGIIRTQKSSPIQEILPQLRLTSNSNSNSNSSCRSRLSSKSRIAAAEAGYGGGLALPPLDLTEDNIRQVLADAKVELGQLFDTSVGITGEVELAELDGPFVKISLRGRFWHKRSTVVARVGNYLKQRIPEILEVEIEDEKQLDDSPENF